MKAFRCDVPSHEEVRKSGKEGPNCHEEASNGNELRTVQLGSKMTDHG